MGKVKELYYVVNERYQDNISNCYDRYSSNSVLDSDYAFEEVDDDDDVAS